MGTSTLTPELPRNSEAQPEKQSGAKTLTPELLHKMDAYWRAANYLAVGQIYLYDNPLLKRPLALADVQHMLLGHWGITPGQNFIYAHLNRVIKKHDLDMIYLVMDTIDRAPGTGEKSIYLKQQLKDKLIEHKQYIDKNGEDLPEIRNWKWSAKP